MVRRPSTVNNLNLFFFQYEWKEKENCSTTPYPPPPPTPLTHFPFILSIFSKEVRGTFYYGQLATLTFELCASTSAKLVLRPSLAHPSFWLCSFCYNVGGWVCMWVGGCACVCSCVRARARACARACVHACVCVCARVCASFQK